MQLYKVKEAAPLDLRSFKTCMSWNFFYPVLFKNGDILKGITQKLRLPTSEITNALYN